MTGSSSTAIALFKMQNVDVFRGHISINHCMQILPVEKSFPCKSLLTALIELTLVTEGMLHADGPLMVLSQEKIDKRQQKCLAQSREQSHKGEGWGEDKGVLLSSSHCPLPQTKKAKPCNPLPQSPAGL